MLNEYTDSDETVLHTAVVNNNEELIKFFLHYGANVNAKNRDGKNPLYLAIEFSNAKVAELLLTNGARVNDRMNNGLIALHEAIKLKMMKEHRICDNISMFNILTKNIRVILGYTRNENLLKIFESNLCSQTFPIYYGTLRERFYEAERRKRLLDRASVTFSWLVKPLSLPDIVTNEILSYLCIEDLIRLKVT